MNTTIEFVKFQGTGNDFILINNTKLATYSENVINMLCDRHFGIGADGVILIESGTLDYDFIMRYFNADGKEATLCGNGSRCAVAFAHNLFNFDENCCFFASDGIHKAFVVRKNNCSWDVSVNFNNIKKESIVFYEDGIFLDTGSPHFVVPCNDVNDINIKATGKQYRYDSRFKDGCNVDFVSFKDNVIYIRTYERGVENETLSCGTGAIAASIVSFLKNNNLAIGKCDANLITKGGTLKVSFSYSESLFANIVLSGGVTKVFEGIYKL